MSELREQWRADFAAKNERRRLNKEADRQRYRVGRRARKEWATNGAFGHFTGWIGNECEQGTGLRHHGAPS